jgi:hypothetical protein
MGAVIAAAGLFAAFCLCAYVAFRILKKTVKTVFRITLVLLMLLIGVFGSVALYSFLTVPAKAPVKARPAR